MLLYLKTNNMKYWLLIFFTLTFFSCSYKNEEDLYGVVVCDTANVRYNVEIKNILQASCLNCHGGTAATGGGVQLGDYASVKSVADNGWLLDALTRTINTMPKGTGKLPNCKIAEIRAWIQKGAPNN